MVCVSFSNIAKRIRTKKTVLDPRILFRLNLNIPQKSTFTRWGFREVAGIDGVLNSIHSNLRVSFFFIIKLKLKNNNVSTAQR